MAHTVIGIFDRTLEAQEAFEQLLNHGFRHEQVDLSLHTLDEQGNYTGRTYLESDQKGYGIGDFFNSLFGNDSDESQRYTEAADRRSIITVHDVSDEEARQAAAILDANGAIDVNENQAGQTNQLSENRATDRSFSEVADNTPTEGEQRIPTSDEKLAVGKQEVEKGQVRSRIIASPVQESFRLRSERVRDERIPADHPATKDDLSSFKEGQIELTEHQERVVTSKEARVVEEIEVSKEVEEREETVKDSVRHTEVDIDNNPTAGPATDPDQRDAFQSGNNRTTSNDYE